MTSSNPNPAWPLRSDGENAGRQLALRAALDFTLCPQQQRRGMLPTEERVLELADRFAAWLAPPQPEPVDQCRPVFQAVREMELGSVLNAAADAYERLNEAARAQLFPADAADEAPQPKTGDPAINAYIASDNALMRRMDDLLQAFAALKVRVSCLERNVARRGL